MPLMMSKRGLQPHEVERLQRVRLLVSRGPRGYTFEYRHRVAVLRGRFGFFVLREHDGLKREHEIHASSNYAALGEAAATLTEWWG